MDYKAICKAITDPENQPHQWNDQDLAEFFLSAADEIERLREALQFYANKKIYIGSFVDAEINWDKGFKARSALQQKESK